MDEMSSPCTVPLNPAESERKSLLEEASILNECASIVESISDQVAEIARNVHTMGVTVDDTIKVLQGWSGNP